MTEPDWTPRKLRGGIYCSPACGYGCKQEWFDQATADAAALAARMGEGWQPEVWENLGWHWIIKNGNLEIHPCRDGTYEAWLQGRPQFIAAGPTPEDALGFLAQDVRSAIRRLEDDLAAAA